MHVEHIHEDGKTQTRGIPHAQFRRRHGVDDGQQLAIGGADHQVVAGRCHAFGIAEEGDAPDGDGQQDPAQPAGQQKGQQVDGRKERDERIAFAMYRHAILEQRKRAAARCPRRKSLIRLYQATRLPVKGNDPKEPALTLPDNLSPSTAPAKSRVMGMGELILADQLSLSPSTLPFSSGPEPWAACWVPVRVAPSVARSSVAFTAPMGELMVISHLPSMAMLRSFQLSL